MKNNNNSSNGLNEQIKKLNTRLLKLDEDLYDGKITVSKFLFAAVAFVILTAVLIAVASIAWPAALIISALSAMFFSKIAHAVSNRINYHITEAKLFRAEEELSSRTENTNQVVVKQEENLNNGEASRAFNNTQNYGPLFSSEIKVGSGSTSNNVVAANQPSNTSPN